MRQILWIFCCKPSSINNTFSHFSPKRYKNYLPCSVIQEYLLCWSSIFNASNINSVKTQCFDYWTWTLVTIVFLFLAFTKALREKNDCGQSLWAVFAFGRFVPLNYRLYKLKSAGNYFKSMMSIEDVKHLLTNKIIFSNNSLGQQNGTKKKSVVPLSFLTSAKCYLVSTRSQKFKCR